ncbi:MAG: hypothetical protein R6V62_09760 [Candidatus Fermentibacteraceae bacterium]
MRNPAPFLLLACACMQEPGPAPVHPSFIAGERTLGPTPSQNCVFTADNRYAVVGDDGSLLFLELVHGRVHGLAVLPSPVLFVSSQQGLNGVLAVTHDSLYLVVPGSFSVTERTAIPSGATACAVSGGRVFLAFTDGVVRGFDQETLNEEIFRSFSPAVTHLAGSPGYLTTVSGTLLTCLEPERLDPLAEYVAWGGVSHLATVGQDRICAAIGGGNEVALFSIPGLELQLMFTVPGTPLVSAVQEEGDYAFAYTDQGVLVVVGSGGGMEWRTPEFGAVLDIVISNDGWNALLLSGSSLFILEK